MDKNIFNRLEQYYAELATVLRGEAGAAALFPNSTDVGMSRENTYAKILETHLPNCCNVYKGGFVYDENGNESKQMDLIIVNNRAIQFNFFNQDVAGKSIACIDGCVGVASIKSQLDARNIKDALLNIASLPDKCLINNSPLINLTQYNYWPYKIVYATDGVSIETAKQTIDSFYIENKSIPLHKRPDMIHVLGKYVAILLKDDRNILRDGTELPHGVYFFQTHRPDEFSLPRAITQMHNLVECQNHMIYNFNWILDKLPLE